MKDQEHTTRNNAPLRKLEAFGRLLRRRRKLRYGLILLGLLTSVALFAEFIAPYDPVAQDREFFFAPPTLLHWVNTAGHFSARPSVEVAVAGQVAPVSKIDRVPVRWLVQGVPYRFWGWWPCRTHLFGVEAPGRLFLFGTDALGRDLFSRVVYGARISLITLGSALLLAIPLALGVGSLSGFYGGRFDFWCMRVVELFLALPALYMVIALRSALPVNVEPHRVFAVIVVVIALFGWANLARVVRGASLDLSAQDFMLAARALGARDARLIVHHLWPNLVGLVLTQAALAAPGYLLAEVTLSYLGLGIPEPFPSWGNMLAAVGGVTQLSRYWWNLAPGVAIFLTSLACYLIAEDLREIGDPRKEPFASIA